MKKPNSKAKKEFRRRVEQAKKYAALPAQASERSIQLTHNAIACLKAGDEEGYFEYIRKANDEMSKALEYLAKWEEI